MEVLTAQMVAGRLQVREVGLMMMMKTCVRIIRANQQTEHIRCTAGRTQNPRRQSASSRN